MAAVSALETELDNLRQELGFANYINDWHRSLGLAILKTKYTKKRCLVIIDTQVLPQNAVHQLLEETFSNFHCAEMSLDSSATISKAFLKKVAKPTLLGGVTILYHNHSLLDLTISDARLTALTTELLGETFTSDAQSSRVILNPQSCDGLALALTQCECLRPRYTLNDVPSKFFTYACVKLDDDPANVVEKVYTAHLSLFSPLSSVDETSDNVDSTGRTDSTVAPTNSFPFEEATIHAGHVTLVYQDFQSEIWEDVCRFYLQPVTITVTHLLATDKVVTVKCALSLVSIADGEKELSLDHLVTSSQPHITIACAQGIQPKFSLSALSENSDRLIELPTPVILTGKVMVMA